MSTVAAKNVKKKNRRSCSILAEVHVISYCFKLFSKISSIQIYLVNGKSQKNHLPSWTNLNSLSQFCHQNSHCAEMGNPLSAIKRRRHATPSLKVCPLARTVQWRHVSCKTGNLWTWLGTLQNPSKSETIDSNPNKYYISNPAISSEYGKKISEHSALYRFKQRSSISLILQKYTKHMSKWAKTWIKCSK